MVEMNSTLSKTSKHQKFWNLIAANLDFQKKLLDFVKIMT